MAIQAPPSLNSKKSAEVDNLITQINQNILQIKENLIGNAIVSAKVIAKVSAAPLVKLLDTYALPFAQSYEKGWGELPGTDLVSMNGVTLDTFIKTFDRVLIQTAVPVVQTAARDFNSSNPNWTKNTQTSKQFLYKFCGDQQIAGLFYYGLITSGTCRWPITVMSEDPYLGYLLGSFVWESGAEVFAENDMNATAKAYGWKGDSTDFAAWCGRTGDKTPELAIKFLQKRVKWIMGQATNVTDPPPPVQLWMDRTVDNKSSHLSMMVIINEMFNLNKGNAFQLSPAEVEHLARKAEIYKSAKIVIP